MTGTLFQQFPLPTAVYRTWDPFFDLGLAAATLVGLLLETGLVFVVIGFLALATKWLIFSYLFRSYCRTSFSRLIVVALLEILCAVAAFKIAFWSMLIATATYITLAMCCNFLLFLRANQISGARDFQFPKKGLCAFSLGLIFPVHMFALALALWYFFPFFFYPT